MSDHYVTVTKDQKKELVSLIRKLPSILAGTVPDHKNIATGFRTRIGYTILSLIGPNFDELGRGMLGADGTKWRPLSREYLAYNRRFGPGEQAMLKKSAGLGKGNRFAPAQHKGLLTSEQLKLWRRTYARALAWLQTKEPMESAKGHAAAIAWNTVKKKGGKTMLEVYGTRQVTILRDTGVLRGSLQPGMLLETGVEATYDKPSGVGGQLQYFDTGLPHQVVVGSADRKASWHHAAKSKHRRRRLWPESFPEDWWNQILGGAISGLVRIGELFKGN